MISSIYYILFECIFQGIAKGMKAMNENYVTQCNQLVDNYNNTQDNFNELSSVLDNLNPVQCFDILDKLCSKFSS